MNHIKDVIWTLRHEGPRATWVKYRWKAVFIIFAYYLVRDTVIYIVLPLVLFL